MERQIISDLQNLKEKLLEMGGSVEKAFEEIRQVIETSNLKLLANVEECEARINSKHMEIDEMCLRVLAKQAPVASDLRLILAIIKINSDLERMGDQAMNIGYSCHDYFGSSVTLDLKALFPMIDTVQRMIRDSLNAFVKKDLSLARQVLDRDDSVDQMKHSICASLSELIKQEKEKVDAALDIMLMTRNFERVADHATNVAENVIFVNTGEDIRHGHSESAAPDEKAKT